jgi:hypothetical protein
MSDRQQFREVLAGLATKTQAKMPTLNGRVEKACKLVLGADVTLLPDGTAQVGSLTDPSRVYLVGHGACDCRDWDHAPEHLCCHRLAVGFQRKALELLPAPTPAPAAGVLPEAPASVNVRLMVNGFEAQITLRGHDETAVLERLQALLKRPDIRPVPKPAPRQGHRGRAAS